MIELVSIDEHGTETALTGVSVPLNKSLSFELSKVDNDTPIVDRSFGDGSVVVGNKRYKKRTLSVSAALSFTQDSDARTYLNSLLKTVEASYYIEDKTNNIRARVVLDSTRVRWTEGCYLRHGSVDIDYVMLDPFWLNTTTTPISQSLIANVPLAFNVVNTGSVPASFRIVVEVATQSTPVALFELTTAEDELSLSPTQFGLVGFEELIIDTESGIAQSGGGTVSADEQGTFADGSGYFRFPVGTTAVSMKCSVDATVTIALQERVFI